jgi:hypothetical protein
MYFMAIWCSLRKFGCILRSFGIFFPVLVHMYIQPWQPSSIPLSEV